MFKILNMIFKWGGGIFFIVMFICSISTKPNFTFLILSVFFLTLNGKRIPNDKYVKLNPGDKITIGNMHLVIS